MTMEAIPVATANEEEQAAGLSASGAVRDASEQQPSNELLPPHLLPLEGRWAVWRAFALRGAGFPAAQVLKLSSPSCAAAADRLVVAELELERARAALLELLRSASSGASGAERDALEKASKKIKKGALPESLEVPTAARVALEDLRVPSTAREAAADEFREAFDGATVEISRALREAASDTRFREAIVWQNRRVWQSGVEPLLRKEEAARDSKTRQHEETVANYVQRYSVKNDTIGFFGPVGWGEFTARGEALTVTTGRGMLAARNLYFEAWAVDALAASLSADKSLRPWMSPRLMPFVELRDGTLRVPGGSSVSLSAEESAVAEACDGERTAREVARGLLGAGGFGSEEAVYGVLESLKARGVIAWAFESPVESNAELKLRRLLERIEDDSKRRDALGALGELETARDLVARAAGDPRRLDEAFDALESTFSRLTGAASTRAAGQTYAGRTVVYEDCRRDAELTVGPEVTRALARPLGLLLESARWVTHEAARRYRKAFGDIYAELAAKSGSRVVSATDFWMKTDRILYKDKTRLADAITPDFQRRWAEVLALPAGARRVSYTVEQLSARVERAFAAPRPGWTSARYHSPDILIAASSPEAVRRGDFQLVMGEIHIGFNNINSGVFMPQHPRPEELHAAIETDFPRPRVVPVLPRHWPEMTVRTIPSYVSPKDYRLLASHDACGVAKARALPLGSLVVEDAGAGLVVRTRDGRVSFDIIEAFAEPLSSLVINTFSMLPPEAHTPRVTLDGLIICRESWRFKPSEMEFAFEKNEGARFAAARRRMREGGLPRFLFVKTKVERKPFYLDLDSPVFVNIFAKAVRRAAESEQHAQSPITLSEMIPDHEQAWLPDGEGNRFTSEIRLVAVDLAR